MRRRSGIEHLLGVVLHLHLVLLLGEGWRACKHMVRFGGPVHQYCIATVVALARRMAAAAGGDGGMCAAGMGTRDRCGDGRRDGRALRVLLQVV